MVNTSSLAKCLFCLFAASFLRPATAQDNPIWVGFQSSLPGHPDMPLRGAGDLGIDNEGRISGLFATTFGSISSARTLAQISGNRLDTKFGPGLNLPAVGLGNGYYHLGIRSVNVDGEYFIEEDITYSPSLGTNLSALWAGKFGQTQLIATVGDQALGFQAGVTFSQFSNPQINSQGKIAVLCRIAGEGIDNSNDLAVFYGDVSGGLSGSSLRGGDVVPGPNDTQLKRTTPIFTLSDSDKLVVSSGLRDVDTDTYFGAEIWAVDFQGGQQLLLRTGDAAPGFPGDNVGSTLGISGYRDDGTLLLYGSLSGINGASTSGDVFWIDRNTGNGLELLCYEGQTVSGTPEPLGNFRAESLTRSGNVLFESDIETDGDSVSRLLLHVPGSGIIEVARTGQPAPGFGNEVVFSDFGRSIANASGHVVFQATRSGPGVDPFTSEGLWAWDGSSLKLVASEGRLADFDPDPAVQDLKSVGGVGFDGIGFKTYSNHHGATAALNDRGQLIYKLRASGGSGFFLRTIAKVGDVNLDGVVDFLDVFPFIDLLTSGTYQVEGDTNEDGVVNFRDIESFISLLAG